MDEKTFKKHLADLAHGHHRPEEHDWSPESEIRTVPDPAAATKSKPKRKAAAKKATTQTTSRTKGAKRKRNDAQPPPVPGVDSSNRFGAVSPSAHFPLPKRSLRVKYRAARYRASSPAARNASNSARAKK